MFKISSVRPHYVQCDHQTESNQTEYMAYEVKCFLGKSHFMNWAQRVFLCFCGGTKEDDKLSLNLIKPDVVFFKQLLSPRQCFFTITEAREEEITCNLSFVGLLTWTKAG